MNDRFKFRAWHEENVEMVYFDNEKAKADQYQSAHFMALLNGDYGDVMMQCTGLKDKNGVLIYEGDIVKATAKPYRFKKHIHWNGRWYQLGTSDILLCDMEIESYGLVVIGNIHENGDLLK